uniref:Tryptophan--tRNA ligase n=1 Tax=Globodera pallida TaxID=36090 RepID=A0A183BW52_GLOPA
MSKVFVSGIQPSGSLHIGNYLGFIKSFVAFQNDLSITRRVLLIADLHSISTGRQEPAQLRLNTLRTLAALLACGVWIFVLLSVQKYIFSFLLVDPERTLLVQQSRLPEHTELMWILGSAATVASLSKLTTAKIRKAFTDFESRVTFDPEQRPGVSNLVTLFSLISGLTVEQVLKQADGIDTLAFKGKLAELINSQLASIRERFSQFVGDERELERLLQYGEERSRPIAVDTLKEVKRIVGMR